MPMWKTWGAVAVSMGLGLLPGAVRAEDVEEAVARPPPRTLVLVHPVNRLGVSVEHALGSHVTLVASLLGDVYLFGSHAAPGTSQRLGVSFDPGVHVYLAGRAPEGFWVGAQLESGLSRFRSTGVSLGGDPQDFVLSSTTYSLGGSARAGYTALLASGLTLQAAVGLGVLDSRLLSEEAPTGGVSSNLGTLGNGWAVEPRLSLGLGWAF